MLHLGDGHIDTGYTSLSAFILENFHIEKLGKTLSAIVHFSWLCFCLQLLILMRFCPARKQFIYFGSEMFTSGDIQETQSIGIWMGRPWVVF